MKTKPENLVKLNCYVVGLNPEKLLALRELRSSFVNKAVRPPPPSSASPPSSAKTPPWKSKPSPPFREYISQIRQSASGWMPSGV